VKRWFLQRRIALAFGLTVFLLSLALVTVSGWTVRSTIQEEIDALAREEMEETEAYYADRQLTPEEFERISHEMRESHRDNPLAWIVWHTADGTPWGEFGDHELLPLAPPERRIGLAVLDSEHRWIAGTVTDELSAGVIVDGTFQVERGRRWILTVAGFGLLATVLAGLAGTILGRRVAGLLERVAKSARTDDGSAASARSWQADDAPEEIRAVVTAMQDTLRRVREETEHAQFLTSGLAHELRSPLQNLMGETQVTLLRERESAEYRRVLESQLEELGELSRLVDNLVTLCADGQGLPKKTRERFDLAAEARLRLVREFALAARRDVRLELELVGPLVVEGDRESLLLALRNVVTNAIEWSPRGSTVAVRALADERGLEIQVDDSGPGIPRERRAHLFQPFQPGAPANGRRVGFGTGLALTQSAIHSHGGRIEIGESPLGGARFSLWVPAPSAD